MRCLFCKATDTLFLKKHIRFESGIEEGSSYICRECGRVSYYALKEITDEIDSKLDQNISEADRSVLEHS